MLDHARGAVALAQGRTRGDLDSDRLLNLARSCDCSRCWEAAARVPAEERGKHPTVPWAELIGLRNRLIHAYDEVDFDILLPLMNPDPSYQ